MTGRTAHRPRYPGSGARRTTGVLAAAAACVLALAAADAQSPPRDDYAALTDTLWTVVDRMYFDPGFLGTDWAAVRQRYRERAAQIDSPDEFHELATSMLREIRSSHLRVRAPRQVRPRSGIGARLATVDGAHVVTEVIDGSHAQRQGLRPGDRLTSPRSLLPGEPGTVVQLEFERCSGEHALLDVQRERLLWPPRRPYLSWSRLSGAPDLSVGLLRVTRFDDGAAALADEAMAALLDADALVIDLRNATGGNMSALRLASWFAPRAEPAVVLLSRQRLQAIGRSPTAADLAAMPRVDAAYTGNAVYNALERTRGGAAFWTEQLPQRFEGPVYVLIGDNTRSAAEAFSWYMRRHTDAVLVGRPTAGSLLSARELPIGDGWWVSVPVHGVWGPDGEAYSDRPVPPHVQTAVSREDLCDGRDLELEAALALLAAD